MKNRFFLLLAILGAMIMVIIISNCRPPKDGSGQEVTKEDIAPQPIKYNFFIENSGSMKGYFSGMATSDLETLIYEYYDRISESKNEKDSVTLNYINTTTELFQGEIMEYLKSTKSKCVEKYSKIDDILKMSMEETDENNVNIVISDFCFESDLGNLQTAQSHITRLFTEQLKKNNDLSVAIIKYMAYFDGLYYPGRLSCKKPMPIYFWIFGNAKQVKKITKITNQKIKTNHCGILLLQSSQSCDPMISIANARAVKNNNIIVKHWDSDRRSKEYIASVKVDLSNIVLNDSDLKTIKNYKLVSTSSSQYLISSISKENTSYEYKISTDKPSPGELTISYVMEMPEWIEESNFEGSGIPTDSTTYGIKYLIGGAFDAYHNNSDNYFTFKIKLQ